ncbi:MAG: hypothetical protein WCL28_05925 [bacterium]|jgi:hypothetical protein
MTFRARSFFDDCGKATKICLIISASLFGPNDFSCLAAGSTPAIPEEFESTGGHSLAFGGSVATAIGGMSAIRSNPALLALEKEYTLNGSYHWPIAGRDFYQVGIIDGKTSPVAAGVNYTSAADDYQGIAAKPTGVNLLSLSRDTPIVRRASLALAMPLGRMYLGFTSSYIEARPPEEVFLDNTVKNSKGFTVGFGAAAHLTPAIRVGISAENLANKKMGYAAPTFYRAGASYFAGDVVSFHLDYRRRQEIPTYEGAAPTIALASDPENSSSDDHENFINLSSSVKVYDLLRLVLSSGQTKTADVTRTRMAGGLSLINRNFNFSYQVLKFDVSSELMQHSLAMGFEVAI